MSKYAKLNVNWLVKLSNVKLDHDSKLLVNQPFKGEG